MPAPQVDNSPVLQNGEKAAPPSAQPTAGPKFTVTGFRFLGNERVASEVLAAAVEPYVGKELGLAELQAAADLVRDKYRDAGYFLARALLPAQEVKDGVVTIRIVEGKIGKAQAQLAPDARVSQSQVDGYMNRLPRGTVITDQSVERPLLLLNDLAGVRLHSVLKPGAEFGEADLDVRVSHDGDLLKGNVYLDNFGNRNVGTVRLGADLEGRSLLKMGELLSLSVLQAEQGMTFGRVGATLPVGSFGTKVSLSYTDLHYEVGGAFKALDADGEGKVKTVSVQHPLVRSRNNTLFLITGIDDKDVNDRQLEGVVQNHRELTVGRIGFLGDFRDSAGGGGLNNYSLVWSRGKNHIRTPDALLQDEMSGRNTRGMFSKINLEAMRLQRLPETGLFGENDSLLMAWRAQYAFDNLDSSEQASLGGPRGVRAYPQGAGAGDHNVMATLEYRRTMPALKFLGANVVLSAFVDYGVVRASREPLPTDTNNRIEMGAFGFGLNVIKRDDFQVRLDVASRLGRDEYQGDDNKRPRGWLIAQKWF